MYKIGHIGRWETLPEAAVAIYDRDLPKLEAMLQGGLDLNTPIRISGYTKLMPLEIAVFRNDPAMIRYLLERGADPEKAEEKPLPLAVVRCCGPEVVKLFIEQAKQLDEAHKRRLFQEIRWGNRPENIPVLEKAGITVAQYGGELKSCAHDREIKNKAQASKERPDKAAGENPRLPSLFARCSGVIRTAVKGFRKKNGSHYHYLQPAASGALGSVCCERMDMLPQTRAASPARDTVRQSRTLKMDHNAISTWG